MGMCVIKGPRILHEDGDGELSPRSVTSSASSSISSSTSEDCGSPTHQELETPVASPVQCYSDGAIWQRMISKGRRCKPLSFSGMIEYDESGNLVKFLLPEDIEDEEEDDEYFSPHRNFSKQEAEFRVPSDCRAWITGMSACVSGKFVQFVLANQWTTGFFFYFFYFFFFSRQVGGDVAYASRNYVLPKAGIARIEWWQSNTQTYSSTLIATSNTVELELILEWDFDTDHCTCSE